MNDPAIIGVAASVFLALLGLVWGMLREQNRQQGLTLDKLVAQNTEQETAIGRLMERMKAREDAHAEYREDVSTRLDRIENLLQRLIAGSGGRGGSPSPYPGAYGITSERK